MWNYVSGTLSKYLQVWNSQTMVNWSAKAKTYVHTPYQQQFEKTDKTNKYPTTAHWKH